jgi:hypothetical protein
MQYRCLVATAVLALTACVVFDPKTPEILSVDRVIAEAVQAVRVPPAEQRAILARVQQDFVADSSAANRLRLATLLATLPEPLRDDARATELLQPLADAKEPGYGRFAALLSAQVAEHARLLREADAVRRDRDRADRERDQREEALRQQVEALRSIERGIQEREERLRRREK